MTLRVRRGTNAERLTVTPQEGEPVYTTDTKKFYVGDGTTVGGVEVTDAENLPTLPAGEALYKLNVDSSGNGTWVEDLLPDPTTGTSTQVVTVNVAQDGYVLQSSSGGGGGVTIVSNQTQLDDATGQGNIIFTTVSGLTSPGFASQFFTNVGGSTGSTFIKSINATTREIVLEQFADGRADFSSPLTGNPTYSRSNTYYFTEGDQGLFLDPAITASAFSSTNEVINGNEITLTLASGPVINSTNFPLRGTLVHTEVTRTLDANSWYGDDGANV